VALSRILLAWFLVAVWLLLWEEVFRRLDRAGAGPRLQAPAARIAGEALLLTLLGALWFASLGTDHWWLVFGLVGTLREWPSVREARRPRRQAWRDLAGRALGALRIVAAGGLLAWRLAPA
jgi:hypothetical protein